MILEVPAGKLEPGEPPETCAARELAEEAGQRPGRLVRTGAIWTTPGFTDERITLFAAFEPAAWISASRGAIRCHIACVCGYPCSMSSGSSNPCA